MSLHHKAPKQDVSCPWSVVSCGRLARGVFATDNGLPTTDVQLLGVLGDLCGVTFMRFLTVARLQLMVYNSLAMKLERIRNNLVIEPRGSSVSENLTAAAVLFPLLFNENELHVLFTKRTQTVKVHKGQISFPGGVHDPHDENLLATALREAQEEIGLKPEDVEILGALDPIATVTTGFQVHTFVGLIPYPYVFKPNGREVAEILTVPLHFLADDNHWSRRSYQTGDQAFEAYFVSYENYRIWGATARILKLFFEKNGVEMNIKWAMDG